MTDEIDELSSFVIGPYLVPNNCQNNSFSDGGCKVGFRGKNLGLKSNRQNGFLVRISFDVATPLPFPSRTKTQNRPS